MGIWPAVQLLGPRDIDQLTGLTRSTLTVSVDGCVSQDSPLASSLATSYASVSLRYAPLPDCCNCFTYAPQVSVPYVFIDNLYFRKTKCTLTDMISWVCLAHKHHLPLIHRYLSMRARGKHIYTSNAICYICLQYNQNCFAAILCDISYNVCCTVRARMYTLIMRGHLLDPLAAPVTLYGVARGSNTSLRSIRTYMLQPLRSVRFQIRPRPFPLLRTDSQCPDSHADSIPLSFVPNFLIDKSTNKSKNPQSI